MSRSTRIMVRWVPAFVWAAVIFTLSAQPGSRVPGRWSTELHVIAYAILGVLVWLALGGRSAGVRGAFVAIALASVYGITDEFHQSFVPQRTPDVMDWLADTVGATVGVTIAYLVALRRSGPSRGSQDTGQ